MKATNDNSATIDTAGAVPWAQDAIVYGSTHKGVDTAGAVFFAQDTITFNSSIHKAIDTVNGTINAINLGNSGVNFTAGNSLTLLGIENNANKDISIEFQGNGNTLTLNNQLTLGKITDLNSTGTIKIEANTTVTLNANCGSEAHPIGSLVLGDNSHLELIGDLYANDITLGNGATILPESMVHLTGGNIDINSDL